MLIPKRPGLYSINSSKSDLRSLSTNNIFGNTHFSSSEKVSLYFSKDTLHGQPLLTTWNFFLSTDLQSR